VNLCITTVNCTARTYMFEHKVQGTAARGHRHFQSYRNLLFSNFYTGNWPWFLSPFGPGPANGKTYPTLVCRQRDNAPYIPRPWFAHHNGVVYRQYGYETLVSPRDLGRMRLFLHAAILMGPWVDYVIVEGLCGNCYWKYFKDFIAACRWNPILVVLSPS
jgi:hypothetical protein